MASPNPQAPHGALRSRVSRTADYWTHAHFPPSPYEDASALPSRRSYRWTTPHAHAPDTRLHTFKYPAVPDFMHEYATSPDYILPATQLYTTWTRAAACDHPVDTAGRDPHRLRRQPPWCLRCDDARRAVDGLRDAAAKLRAAGGPGPWGGTVWWEERDNEEEGEQNSPVILVPARQAVRHRAARKAWDEARLVVGNLRAQAWEDGVSVERALEGADELVAVFSGRVDFTGQAPVELGRAAAGGGPAAVGVGGGEGGDEGSEKSSRLGWCVEFKTLQQHRMPMVYRSDVEFQRSAPQYRPGLWAGDLVDTSGMKDGFKDEEVEDDTSAMELFKAGGLGSLIDPPYIGSVARMPTATRKRKWVEED
ncbi:hypothetical protein NpPPO83_00011976 [Neofusicoccum parvum]|uniref:Uncharacterized protein n=1 Tax=Neofusicoccum parvum TaxID=310453 RepID=A0ACB5SGY2_9PEZI|nr:hypothetical protein NpPPO83_00011976 [Neofusicoccum parvum]